MAQGNGQRLKPDGVSRKGAKSKILKETLSRFTGCLAPFREISQGVDKPEEGG
jgi:hypothetical protein